jgi:BatD DUF11 like domain
LLFSIGGFAQSTASASLDSNYVETGEAFDLHLTVTGEAAPGAVDFAAWDTLVPPDNRLQQSEWQRNGDQWTKTVRLLVFDSANLQLPPLTINLANGSSLKTNPLSVYVLPTPSPEDPKQIADIKDIWRAPKPWIDPVLLRLILFVLGAVAIFLILFTWLRNRKKGALSRTVAMPAHELALRKLEVLEQRQLWQQGQLNAYYTELSYIIREYLKSWAQAPILEWSTADILTYFERRKLQPPQMSILRELLRWADLAKFAQTAPPDAYHPQGSAHVRSLIETLSTPTQKQNTKHITNN